ncbi:uncharacterized protein N7477_008234 [Penicillium maclennaniae]|uniref:uncharacterized protein n=1 Tax=Penicillium maclennaniae TaxID=1343394 RepID=UPI0025402E7A|nr:uncharacterized protein N7477_008234 [Penicillium maclennaniae]KAJ5665786.1 hypothetical protein N7477_008234 [Penicillium maclennaniae]
MAIHNRSPSSPTPDRIFLEACDIYFRHCHNKPYGFFNSDLFHHKATKNQVPLYLRLALIATATRYSSRSQWKERKQSTIDEYARCAWEQITTSPDALGEHDDVAVIQALALLAVIDATAGRRRGAWVKIGMAVRISQDLRMMQEPSSRLCEMEREERRNLFWSLYLLDRFVCCSFQRPPAIQDSDCLLNLPTYHGSGKWTDSITLSGLLDEKVRNSTFKPGMFGISIGLAAVLGRTIKCMMNNEPNQDVPWHPVSEYGSIYTDLEFLKELAVKNGPVLAEPGQPRSQNDMSDGDREQIAHMVLSHTLYHLSHCILGHPFLLGMKLQSSAHSEIPSAWLDETRSTCLKHAGSLVTVLVEAKAAGYMPVPSVYSYCILVASTIHALHVHSDDLSTSRSSAEYLRTSLYYLGEISELWSNAQMMANALKAFAFQCARYRDILLRNNPRVEELTETEMTILKSVVDYWTMMDPQNPVFDLIPSDSDSFSEIFEKGHGYLTPPSPALADGVTLGVSMPDFIIHKGYSANVDPDILVRVPLSAMSPIASDDGKEPGWDWETELNAFHE